MTSIGQKQKSDCVIVAIANATGLSYDEVAAKLPKPNPKTGLSQNQFTPLLAELGWIRQNTVPRRGQDKISGLVKLRFGQRKLCHLVYMKNGLIFDAFNPTGISINSYRAFHRSRIDMIWIRPTVKAEPKQDTPFTSWHILT